MYENGTMRPIETILQSGGGGIKENDGGVNLTKIYCKHFCKCYNGPPQSNNMTIKSKKITRPKWTEDVVQVVEHLFCRWKALSSNLSPAK
jgi:hypothetical protein